jgi:hypothetical protein
VRHYATENPYQSDWIPLLSDFRRDVVHYRWRLAKDAENAKRREVETLYQVERDKPSRLLDEGIEYNRKPRDPGGLTWAAARLVSLGFERVEEERVVTFRRSHHPLELYADPRQTKALLFKAYAPKPPEPVKKRRGYQPPPVQSVEFYLSDSAGNDLPGQFLKALGRAIEKAASYRKEFRKAPWVLP